MATYSKWLRLSVCLYPSCTIVPSFIIYHCSFDGTLLHHVPTLEMSFWQDTTPINDSIHDADADADVCGMVGDGQGIDLQMILNLLLSVQTALGGTEDFICFFVVWILLRHLLEAIVGVPHLSVIARLVTHSLIDPNWRSSGRFL